MIDLPGSVELILTAEARQPRHPLADPDQRLSGRLFIASLARRAENARTAAAPLPTRGKNSPINGMFAPAR
jgi:hypothetical protein